MAAQVLKTWRAPVNGVQREHRLVLRVDGYYTIRLAERDDLGSKQWDPTTEVAIAPDGTTEGARTVALTGAQLHALLAQVRQF